MYLPSVLRPLPVVSPVSPAVQRISEAPFSVVRGAPGSFIAERLAGVIDSWDRLADCVWLRACDPRPEELAKSLAAACRHRWSAGDDADAGLHDIRLSEEITRAPDGAVIILELGGRMTPGVARLVRTMRPAITDRGVNVVAVAETRFHSPMGGGPDRVIPASDLLDRGALDVLPLESQARLLRFADRHAAVVHDVVHAAQVWSPAAVAEALNDARSLSSLLGRITTGLVAQLTPEQRSALDIALTTGYWHPHLGTQPVAADELRPWLVPLEHEWGWLRPIWTSALRRELARSATPITVPVRRTVAGLVAGRAAPVERGHLRVRTTVRTVAPSGSLEVRLLGSLEVRVDGAEVRSWHGQRGISVLRYLLSHPRHACSRDELLEQFWPDVPPGAARNRLQVAVSGLRRAFAGTTTVNVVEYAGGEYRINPDLGVEVDVERFERSLRDAAAAERAGDREEGRTQYRKAVGLYRGDFAADAPFESWTLLPRESLRIELVDALDRLSRIELAEHRIDDCIATAHRMLDIDPCREDAHRLLMRCYASQGRIYQALRQYEFCERILRATIDAEPAPDTTRLYRSILGSSAPVLARIG